MAIDVKRSLDFGGSVRILSLPNALTDQEPATLAQLKSAIEGLAQKDNVRVSTTANINLAAPGAAVDGIAMAGGDRVLVRAQTTQTENGIYIWNGAAVLMTRSLDTSTFDELESALVPVDEGTNAGQTWRQTAVNGVIGTSIVLFAQFGTGASAATETSQGIAEIATQAETDAGTDDARFVTPLKLATSAFGTRKINQNIGDGAATSYVITHNLNTRDVEVDVYRNSGNFDTVLAEVQRTSLNAVTVLFDVAPTAAAFRVLVRA